MAKNPGSKCGTPRYRIEGVPRRTLRITAKSRNYTSRVDRQGRWFLIDSKWIFGCRHVATRIQVWDEMPEPESKWYHMGIEDCWQNGYTGLLYQSRQYEIRIDFVSCGTKPICPMRGQDESRDDLQKTTYRPLQPRLRRRCRKCCQ